jgi:hypothetical protein
MMASKVSKKTDTKPNMVLLALMSILVGWIFGYIIGSSNSSESVKESTSNNATVHAHEQFELGKDTKNIPTVKVLAVQDKKAGWNLSLVTSNFSFTPEDVNGKDVVGEGHAHLWVDGEKITRLYGNHYYIDALSQGDHEITVTLNTNSHKDYVVDGKQIADTITVTEDRVANASADTHSHDEDGEPVDSMHN